MSRKKNNKAGAVIIGPVLVIGGVLALWENEGRFDYFKAAREAAVIASPGESVGEPVAFTDALNTDIPIAGEYVDEFVGYLSVERLAEIYSWERDEDSDGDVSWSLGWQSGLENNSRNEGLTQVLRSGSLYPEVYELGSLSISPTDIHFVDGTVSIAPGSVRLSTGGTDLGLRPDGDTFHLDKGQPDDLGDERIQYFGVPNAPTASYFGLIADGRGVGKRFEQNDGIISSIIDNDGMLHHLVNGSREGALEKIRADLVRKTWLVRLFGTLAIVFGFLLFFGVFATLLYRIPILGGLVQFGVFVISLVLGLGLALTVMLAGFVFHHPLTVALPLALVIGGAIWFVRKSRVASRNAKSALAQKVAAQQAAVATPPPLPPLPTTPAAEPPPLPAMPVASPTEVMERTFVNLALVAMSEGGLARSEEKFLKSWGDENGISSTRMEELLEGARHDPPEAHPATRDDLELMACVAMADGVLSHKEWRFLMKIAEKVGIDRDELRRMLTAIENGTALPAAT